MADEKLNVSPEENPQPSLFDTGPADAPAPETSAPEPPAPENIPEQAAVDAPAQDAPAGAPGEVSVSADQIEKLMAERRAAERAEVEKNEPPEPEQPPTPSPEDKAAEDKGPAKKGKTTGEKTPEPEKPKAKRGRKPKEEKAGPGEPGGTGARKGRPPKADKAAPDKPPSPPRDKMSQSKGAKAATVKGREEAPAAPAPEPPPRPVEEQKIVYLKISELNPFHTFRQHPFKVVDDSPRMQELVTSIKAQGVFTPATVRPEKDGSGYEIVAGHCRCRGSELAGLTELPCIVREMTDHEAVQEMKNSNKQRGEPLPSELARLLDLEMEDIKHQGARMKDVAEGDIGKRSAEIVGENNGMNYKKVMRYIRLNYLVPELLDKVDEKKMGFMPAVELSFIRPKNQRLIAVSIDGEQASPSVAQAKKLRELDKEGKLNGDVIDGILSQEKKEVDRVIITTDELNRFFGKEATPRQMKDQIMSLLTEWKEKQPPERTAPEKKTDREK